MASDNKNPTGAGCIIALFILIGAILGGLFGQPSIGLLSGIAIGAAIAIIMWLRERSR